MPHMIKNMLRLMFQLRPVLFYYTGFGTIKARRMSLVEQKLLTLPEHSSSSPEFRGVHVSEYLAFCVVFLRSLFVFLVISVSVRHRFLITFLVCSYLKLEISILCFQLRVVRGEIIYDFQWLDGSTVMVYNTQQYH